MTWKDATDALLAFFNTQWSALHATIPVNFPNAKSVSADASSEPWLRYRALPTFSRRIAVGGPLRIQGGQVVVEVFTPRETGDGAAEGYGREIEAIWEDAHDNGLDGGIHLDHLTPLPGAADPDVPFWHSGVSVSFTFDHTP